MMTICRRPSSPCKSLSWVLLLFISYSLFPTGAFLFLEAASLPFSHPKGQRTTHVAPHHHYTPTGFPTRRSRGLVLGFVEGQDGRKGQAVKALKAKAKTTVIDRARPAPAPLTPNQPDMLDARGGALTAKKKKEEPNVWSAVALVAGTTVGAGILALPAVTIQAGFIPSSFVLIGAWIYMVVAALLIAEVNLNLTDSHAPTYLFLHYALLVAYIAQGGEVLLGGLGKALSFVPDSLPSWVPPSLFVGLFGGALAFGDKKFLEQANNIFVLVVVASFLGLVFLASPQVEFPRLLEQQWLSVFKAVPVMFVSLVFHNVVPYLEKQLQGNPRKIRQSIVLGSALPLVMFITWNAVILGMVPLSAVPATGAPFDPLAFLRKGQSAGLIGNFISVFSEFAIVTSFTGFVYGLKDFFIDLTSKASAFTKGGKGLEQGSPADLLTYALILIPPLIVAAIDPEIFLPALEFAGTFGICVLFGLFPGIMAGITRSRHKGDKDYIEMVPGGVGMLTVVVAVPAAIILQTLLERLPK